MNIEDKDNEELLKKYKTQEYQKYTDFGYYFCKGVFKAIANYFILGCVLFGIISAIVAYLGIGIDDSDLDKYTRSGVKIITDYKYGTQYIETTKGHITPRLDKSGKYVVVDISSINK